MGTTPLAWALAALMRPGRWSRAGQKLACLRPVACAALDEARQAMLVNVVETYLQLDEDEEAEYMKLLEQEPNTKVQELQLTWFDRIEAQGREEGLLQGLRQVLLGQLTERFGALPGVATQRLQAMQDADRLLRLSRELLHARSLAELGLT